MTTRLLIGQPRFSVDHEWIDLPEHFLQHLDVEVLPVEACAIESTILDGFRPETPALHRGDWLRREVDNV